jgi:hypothetical protein
MKGRHYKPRSRLFGNRSLQINDVEKSQAGSTTEVGTTRAFGPFYTLQQMTFNGLQSVPARELGWLCSELRKSG